MSENVSKQMQLRRLILRALDNFKRIRKSILTPAKVRSRISMLKDTWSRFLDGYVILCKVISETSQPSLDYFQDEVFETTEDAFQTTLNFMAENLEELEPPVSPNSSLEHTLSRAFKSALSINHLPPISLPPFEQWKSFRNRFTALIIENRDLSNVKRMHFLTSCVTGRACDCIRDLPVTADNFEPAWLMLTTRFENKRRILNGHFTSLLNLPVIARESAAELASLCDKVKVAVAPINNVNRSSEQLWDDILVHIIVGKLDPITRKTWTLQTGEDNDLPSYGDLSRFISRARVRALEDFATDSPSKIISRASVATASTVIQCPLCKENHLFSAYPLFIRRNINQRRELVSRHRQCFNCLSDKHSIKDCKSKYSCRICQRKHHTLLHMEASASKKPRSPDSTSGSSSMIESIPSSSQAAPPHLAANSLLASTCVHSNTQVLLAIAWVTVSVESGRSVTVRALLDQGSEITFISESLAQLLRVKRVRMPVTVSAVGCVTAGTFWQAANIFVSPRNSLSPVISTVASILPSLTSYAPKRIADISSCSHLTDLQWADSDPMSIAPISLILGADLYSSIILEGLRKGDPRQPVAQNTIFG
ncbi:uncharacterized protein LOC116853519 [Odontomachus brunneus]|uniref:uncharacterized protein LOC116853519 n=1 Tax=Odontomachus brunneus TaxID=486640 RepID=UPI0013F1D56E|nr:uncharacterized protein LOC116853519 [Odontomachus brunneus]